jgi:hypothetical protein
VVGTDDIPALRSVAITFAVVSVEFLFDSGDNLRGVLVGPGGGFNYPRRSQVLPQRIPSMGFSPWGASKIAGRNDDAPQSRFVRREACVVAVASK